ncbi:YggN family protein [Paenibacillus kobensis]|uniref:DUF4160 domain-containing protein n=1 Tax=Paenibacillus kobensis TaxID=59841 RepID=UPI000FD87225|nr:DUF4160 domain-containing protein [Paenibacillus kobensis]
MDSYSNVDYLIDDPMLGNNAYIWNEAEYMINNFCESDECVAEYETIQSNVEKSSDEIRNNPCSYFDCSAGKAEFIIDESTGKAIGVRLLVQYSEPSSMSTRSGAIPMAFAAGLPPKTITNNNSVGRIEHYFHSNDHLPAHVHVIDSKGKVVRVGENGKPLKGEPELNRSQQQLVTQYKSQIRNTVGKIIKWQKANGGMRQKW